MTVIASLFPSCIEFSQMYEEKKKVYYYTKVP